MIALFINMILAFIFMFCRCANSAGVAVHLNIASRIKEHLPFKMNDHQAEYNAGSFYPDAFYNCLGLSLVAEHTHWPIFLKEAVEYYKQEYTEKNKQNDGLKAFIYGIFTHQIADISWHSLLSQQGFLQYISELEFNGDIEKAHQFIDVACDFILLNKDFGNLSAENKKYLVRQYQKRWKYDSAHIVNIYHRMGIFDVDSAKLQFCIDRGYSALQAEVGLVLGERKVDQTLYMMLMESPLTVASLDGYFYGGVDEIVNTLISCLKDLDNWFFNEINDPWSICRPLFKKHPIKMDYVFPSSESIMPQVENVQIESQKVKDSLYISTRQSNSKFGMGVQFGEFLGEKTLVISAPYEDNYGAVYMLKLKDFIPMLQDAIELEKYDVQSLHIKGIRQSPIREFAPRFGDKLLKWVIDDNEFLIIAEPGTSTIKVFLKGQIVAVLKSQQTSSHLGSAGKKQWSILNSEWVDLNFDGHPDIIIGSMYSDGTLSGFQSGLVISIDGKKLYEFIKPFINFSHFTNVPVILIESVANFVFNIPETLKLKRHYENFGSSFAATESHIFIGAGSEGKIVVYDKMTKDFVGCLVPGGFVSCKQSVPFQAMPSKKSSLFAWSNIVTGVVDGITWILTTAPGYSYNGRCPLCGIAYVYIIKDGTFCFQSEVTPFNVDSFPGEYNSRTFYNSFFGLYVKKLNESIVSVSAAGFHDGQGALFLVNLDQLIKFPADGITADLLITGYEGFGFMDYGHSVSELFCYEKETYLAIGLPSYFFPQSEEYSQQTGGVQILKISNPLVE